MRLYLRYHDRHARFCQFSLHLLIAKRFLILPPQIIEQVDDLYEQGDCRADLKEHEIGYTDIRVDGIEQQRRGKRDRGNQGEQRVAVDLQLAEHAYRQDDRAYGEQHLRVRLARVQVDDTRDVQREEHDNQQREDQQDDVADERVLLIDEGHLDEHQQTDSEQVRGGLADRHTEDGVIDPQRQKFIQRVEQKMDSREEAQHGEGEITHVDTSQNGACDRECE